MTQSTASPVPVLFVDHATALGGAQHYLLQLFAHLDRRAFEPHLATQPGALATAAAQLDVRIHTVPLTRLRRHPLAGWRLAHGSMELLRVIRRERIALIQHNTMRASIYATLAARLAGRPLVWQVHDIFPIGPYVRSMCRLADTVIAVAAAVAAPLPCTQKIRIVHNGVCLDDFDDRGRESAAHLRAAWGVPASATLIGQIARLQAWKGQRDVVAVAEIILREFPDAYFVLVGGDVFDDAQRYEAELRTQVTRRGLASRVIFAGHQRDVIPALYAIDILINASIGEAFGRILIEASAASRPVVAYASGGVLEAVVDQQTGLLAAAGDRAALAAALAQLLRDPARARRLGEAGREWVGSRFDVRRLTRQVEEAFHATLANAAPRS